MTELLTRLQFPIPHSCIRFNRRNFRAVTNGYIALSNASSAAATGNNWQTNFSIATDRNIVAAYFDDLTTNPNTSTQAQLDNSLRYYITPGSPGTRQVIVEWYKMTFFGLLGPELYFQVVLDETDNSISFKYGNMQLYNGTQDIRWTYAAGISGAFVAAIPTPGQVFQQQFENTTAFDNINGPATDCGANGLMISPEPRSTIKLTPGFYSGYTPPTPTAPSMTMRPELSRVPSLTAFRTNIAWNTRPRKNLFTSRKQQHQLRLFAADVSMPGCVVYL